MSIEEKTMAGAIAAQFDNDGTCWVSEDGTEFDDAITEAGAYAHALGQVEKATFADGSALIIGPDYWDIALDEHPDCFCFAGAGRHEPHCKMVK